MRKIIAILLSLGLLRGCSYVPDLWVTDIPVVEPEPSAEYTLHLEDTRCPQVLTVTVENGKDPYIRNMLDVHVLHTGVVGLFGCPVEVEGVTENSRLIFRYDPANMNQVPSRNLIGLYYNEEEYNYEELEPTLDTENCTVSFDVDRDGAYMLVDLYEWFRAWGADLPEYAHPLEFTFEGGYYPSYYPSFTVTVPEGTTLEFGSDTEDANPETGLVVKDYFKSEKGSRLDIDANVVRGENLTADIRASVEYIKSNPEIDGVHLWGSLEEITVEQNRIILLQRSLWGREMTAVSCIYLVSDMESVSMGITIPDGDPVLEKEMLDFVTGIKFYETSNPWYKNT